MQNGPRPSFEERLTNAAKEARERAQQLPSSEERDALLLRANNCETAIEFNAWVTSGRPPE
jgi:hypothetical protein